MISSTGGVTISPVSGFFTPGWPGTSSFSPTGTFGSNSSLWFCGISSPPNSTISSTGAFVTSSCALPTPTFSPVIGLTRIGVVIVFSPGRPSCFTFSVPGAKLGLNSRFFSNGISSVVTCGFPSFGPYFVISSTGGVTISPVSGFFTPGWPGTSSFSPTGTFGSNSSLWFCGISSPPNSTISSTGAFVTSSCALPTPTFSPVIGLTRIGVVIVFSPGRPSCFTFSVPGAKLGLNSRFFSNGISSVVTCGFPSFGPYFIISSLGCLIITFFSGSLNPLYPSSVITLFISTFGSNIFLVS